MQRVLIIQPNADDEAAYLSTWLKAQSIGFDIKDIDAGDRLPQQLQGYTHLAMLGGPMSVNDDLPFLHQCERLFKLAISQHIPIVGHCLGGQMLAKALGASVTDNPAPEIGWSHIHSTNNAAAQHWLGTQESWPVYQWHYQSFALPEGAQLLAQSAVCRNQVFSYGPHIGMQFHVEVDAAKLERWAEQMTGSLASEVAQVAHFNTVQNPQAMRASTQHHLAASQELASHIYTRWLHAATHKQELSKHAAGLSLVS